MDALASSEGGEATAARTPDAGPGLRHGAATSAAKRGLTLSPRPGDGDRSKRRRRQDEGVTASNCPMAKICAMASVDRGCSGVTPAAPKTLGAAPTANGGRRPQKQQTVAGLPRGRQTRAGLQQGI